MECDERPWGIPIDKYMRVETLVDAVLKLKWARTSLSDKFVRECFLEWAEKSILKATTESFCDYLLFLCSKKVVKIRAVVPIQYLAVEERFEFGPGSIIPFGDGFFSDLERNLESMEASKADRARLLYERMKSDMKDCAAFELELIAEPNYAQEISLQLATDMVGLLRFLSPASGEASLMSPLSPLGATHVPDYHVITLGINKSFSYTHGMAAETAGYWLVSKYVVEEMRRENLEALGQLLLIDGLSEFARSVRSSILAFSRALTFPDMSDRLIFAFSAIEGLMLKDQSEPIQQNVGERVAFLTTNDPEERQSVVGNFRSVYRMRSQYIHHRLTTIDLSELNDAFENIRNALAAAVENLDQFATRQEFLAAIDRRKYGA